MRGANLIIEVISKSSTLKEPDEVVKLPALAKFTPNAEVAAPKILPKALSASVLGAAFIISSVSLRIHLQF